MPTGNNKAAGIFGGMLAAIREKKRMKQADLSVQTGISTRTLAHYENGERLPSLPTFYTLVTTLRLRPHSVLKRIFGGDR